MRLCSALFLAALLTSAASATILTFTQTGSGNVSSFETTLAAYGDNVNSLTQIVGPNTFSYGQGNAFTPDVAVSYSHTPSVSPGTDLGPVYYTDGVWSNPVNYLHAFSGSSHFLTFTPTAAFTGVLLNSVDIDLYTGIAQPGNSSITWNVRDNSPTGTILATGTETAWTNGENRTLNLGSVLNFDTTVLEVILTSVGTGSVGLDNLNFDQLILDPNVPEPSTGALLGLAAVGLAWNARRKRSASP